MKTPTSLKIENLDSDISLTRAEFIFIASYIPENNFPLLRFEPVFLQKHFFNFMKDVMSEYLEVICEDQYMQLWTTSIQFGAQLLLQTEVFCDCNEFKYSFYLIS
jgi:hypothetical protein